MHLIIGAALGFAAPFLAVSAYIGWKMAQVSSWWANAENWPVPPLIWLALLCAGLGAILGAIA